VKIVYLKKLRKTSPTWFQKIVENIFVWYELFTYKK